MASKAVEAREAFAQWLSTPIADREFPSERSLARHLGVSTSSLHRWRNDWRFAADVQNRLSRNLDIGVIPDIMATLVEQATDPSSPRAVSAARTLLEYVRWNLERTEDVNLDIRTMSDDELRDLMISALDVIDERERTDSS